MPSMQGIIECETTDPGPPMRMIIMAVALTALGACGAADTATTAATGAAIKKGELEGGKKTMERARDGVNQTLDQGQQRNKDAEK